MPNLIWRPRHPLNMTAGSCWSLWTGTACPPSRTTSSTPPTRWCRSSRYSSIPRPGGLDFVSSLWYMVWVILWWQGHYRQLVSYDMLLCGLKTNSNIFQTNSFTDMFNNHLLYLELYLLLWGPWSMTPIPTILIFRLSCPLSVPGLHQLPWHRCCHRRGLLHSPTPPPPGVLRPQQSCGQIWVAWVVAEQRQQSQR